jgi:hypothetical protein
MTTSPLINTRLQWGDSGAAGIVNRFSGFHPCTETAKAVLDFHSLDSTPLKRSVSERLSQTIGKLVKAKTQR